MRNDVIAIVGGLVLYAVFVVWAHARLIGVRRCPERSVIRADVAFGSQGTTCRAWHYTPDDGGDGTTRPCVVMAHGFGATRDASLEPYA